MLNVGEQAISQSRKVNFSRTYTTKADVLAGAISNEIFIAEEDEWRHAPFDTILIANLDAVDLEILLDGNPDNTIPVTKGQTVGGSDQNFRNFKVKNLDGVTKHTLGKIRILVQQTKREGEK